MLKPLAIAGLLCMAAAAASADQEAARIEVPIAQTRLTDGTIRYSVEVSIGGASPIEAMLDTGSFGLRVLSRALMPDRYETTPIMRNYAYASGIDLHGPLARAVIKIGDASTGAPILFQLVQSVGCVATRARCPASRISAEEYEIGGNGLPHEGFAAILGLSMRAPATPEAAVNPLSFIGDRVWSITLPLPGENEQGALIIDPGAAELHGFGLAHVLGAPQPGGQATLTLVDNELPGSLVGGFGMKIDSGASNGLTPFYRYTVLFDLQHFLIGVKPRRGA